MLGRKYSDPVIQENIKKWPFRVKQGKNDSILVEVTFKGKVTEFSPEQLAGFMLSEAQHLATSFLSKGEVKDVVIGVPQVFSQPQKDALLQAAKEAGLNVLRLISEPCAAAIAYGFDQKDKETQVLGVLDFGAGSLDVTILRTQDGLLEVLSSASDARLGGYEVDNRFVEAMALQFSRKTKLKLEGPSSERALLRLRAACQSVKKNLSSVAQASLGIDSLFEGKDMSEDISRARFDTFTTDLLQLSVESLQKALSDAKLDASQLSQVLLVGGSSRIPKFRQIITNFLGPHVPVLDALIPEEAGASGAAIQASLLGPLSQHPQLTQPPKVPVSAATLGLSVAGGVVAPVIPRGCPLPCTRKVVASNQTDDQTSMTFLVTQGERLRRQDNQVLASLTLKDLAKGPRGTVKVEVEMNLSAEADLTVKVTELSSNRSVEAKVAKGEEKQPPSSRDVEADSALRQQIVHYLATKKYAEGIRNSLKDKSLKDEGGAILAVLVRLLKWVKEVDSSEQFPPHELTSTKAQELRDCVEREEKKGKKAEAGKEKEEEEEEEEGEGDEGEEGDEDDGPAVASEDEDLD